MQRIGESKKDTEGMGKVGQPIHHHVPFQDDPHSGWVQCVFLTHADK